ncbi:phage baseplate assembly protein V [Brevundimonas sp.]|uniref:phage baseplate assembly protein V n=1 Tax=Brevundimonas sp. TaxID=1871086 RepID=UPI003D6D6B97
MNRALFERLSAPMRNRIQMMVSRAVLQLVDDAGGIQAMQFSGLSDELIEGAERFQDYGFTSVPLPGAEAALVFPGGLRSHGLVVAVGDRRYRLKGLKDGEVAVYDDQGQQLLLGRDGIRLVSSLKVEIEAPEVAITAAEKATITAPSIVLDGEVDLGGEGGKPIGRHGDAVVADKVVASTTKVRAA